MQDGGYNQGLILFDKIDIVIDEKDIGENITPYLK